MVALAWVADDASITFRVVDNLLGGYGLRWNVDERVEVATHPLWLLLHVPVYAVTGNVFLATLGLCLACSAGAVALAAAAHVFSGLAAWRDRVETLGDGLARG